MDKEELTVGLFRPEDAKGVTELFTEVYGDKYPAKIVYDPDGLIRAFENRDNIPVVVRTARDEVVGYSSLFRAAPEKGVYEKGNGAVHPSFRNAGIMGMIFQYVGKIVPGIEGIKVFFGEPVCNHVYIQKAALANLPFVETAIELDLMPAEAYDRENSASGRVATLLMFITVVPHPHPVYLPERYADFLEYIYAGLDDRRSFARATADLPAGTRTKWDTQIFDFARVARIAVHEAGPDFMAVFTAEEKRIIATNVKVIQVWLKLSWQWAGRLADFLADSGYVIGGVLPQWFGEDALFMQKIIARPNWEDINVFSDRAHTIRDFVKSDWEERQKAASEEG